MNTPDPVDLLAIIATAVAEVGRTVRYSLASNQRAARLAFLITIVMVGLYFLL